MIKTRSIWRKILSELEYVEINNVYKQHLWPVFIAEDIINTF